MKKKQLRLYGRIIKGFVLGFNIGIMESLPREN